VWPKDPPKELKTPVLSTNPQQFLTTSKSNHTSFANTLNSLYGPKDGSSTSGGSGNRMQDSVASVTRSNTSYALDQDDERRRREELAYKYVKMMQHELLVLLFIYSHFSILNPFLRDKIMNFMKCF
jgi:amyloid beta (A4) precursor protein-binding family B protein 2 (Fe65-like)